MKSAEQERTREIELVEALAQGDSQRALMELYDQLAPTVMAVLLDLLPTEAEAEGRLEDVFVELWRGAGRYQPARSSVRAWALGITRDLVRDADSAAADRSSIADAVEPVAPPANAFKRIQAAIDRVTEEDADTATTPAPRPSELHPETRRVVARAQRRATRAIAFATFAFAAAAALGFMWYRARDKQSTMRQDLTVAGTRASTARAILLQELDQEREQRKVLSTALAELKARDRALPSARLRVAKLAAKSGASAIVLLDPESRRWMAFGFDLPAISERDYQLWFLPANNDAPISAGVLQRSKTGALVSMGRAPEGLGPARAALSLEPKGGSKRPNMAQITMIGEL